MAIDVITGQPRNGKSQYALKLIFDDIKENDKLEKEGKPRRPIFSDIAGINAPSTPTQLPDVDFLPLDRPIWFGDYITAPHEVPDGYWCPPPNSIFYFDECHKLEWVKDVSGTLSKNPTTISLNEHGHIGHDIKLITQFPNYIHTHIRGLVQHHYHVKRVHGASFAWVYKWDDFQINPRTKTAIADAFETDKFFFKKKYQNAYQSASAHSKIKFKFPAKLIPFIVAIVVIFGLLWYVGKDSMFGDKLGVSSSDDVVVDDPFADAADDLPVPPSVPEPDILSPEQLRYEYLPKHIAVMAHNEEVRPAMIIQNDGGCQAFNKYGEYLVIPESLCHQMITNPSLIPKSRQKRSVPVPPSTPSNANNNPLSMDSNGQLDIDYVDNSGFITGG